LATDVIEGYGAQYTDRHDKPLPQATIDKILLLYHHRIERRCDDVGLTVEEEEAWDMNNANIDVDALSNSGEESEERDSDDVNFYSDADEDSDNDEDDSKTGKADDVSEGKVGGKAQIARWEDEIASLRANLSTELAVLHRMTNSPNRKNPYNKLDEWSAWKTNDVEKKIDELKAKIEQLKGTITLVESPIRKRGKQSKS